jgi:hypothetical protein
MDAYVLPVALFLSIIVPVKTQQYAPLPVQWVQEFKTTRESSLA